MSKSAEELLYDLAEMVRPGARAFHGMCPEKAAAIVEEAPAEVSRLREEVDSLREDVDTLSNGDNWCVEWNGPRLRTARI